MWVDADGNTSNWSAGSAFWQWYVWQDKGVTYDMDQGTYPGIIYLGCQPSNAAAVAGKTVTSKAKIEVNGTTYDWVINFHYAETEAVVEGSGKLSRFVWDGDDYHTEESLSNYSWTLAAESGLEIFVEVNTEEWTESGDWMIGWFDFPRAQFKEVAGFDPAELDESTFYALDDFDDPVEEMSSYKPGMWVDEKGLPASGWSDGTVYWQWYVWGGKTDKNGKVIGYDYDYEKHPDIFVVGGNPGNVSKITFEEPFTTRAMMVGAGGKDYPVTITYTFKEQILPETEGYPEAVFEETGTPYPYGGGVDGDHTIQWYFDENGLTVDVDAYVPSTLDGWIFTAATIPTSVMTSYLGIDDIEKLYDLTYFYPLNPDGTPCGDWTTNKPGQWVHADGTASGWSEGAMYWWYQWGDHKYEGHFTEGLFLVGTNPSNVESVAGQTVTSKAQLGDKLLTVNVHYYAEYPTAKTGKVGPYAYNWTLGDDGVDIVAEVSASQMDGSWAWMGFFVNEKYINARYGYNLTELVTDFENGFYPVAPDGTTKLEKWTSYVPGMWFAEDGAAGGYAFWQYYTSNYADLGWHDFQTPGLCYVGKNPGNTYTPGTSATSKAIAGGKAFNVTLKVVE